MLDHSDFRRCMLAVTLAASLGLAPCAMGAERSPVVTREDSSITYAGWRALLGRLAAVDELAAAVRINSFVNRLRAASDRTVWGKDDHWATPAQFFSRGSGDCEDFALAKYQSLLHLGVPPKRLWLGYSRVKQPGRLRIEPHMVLIYEDRGGRHWVMDNLGSEITILGARSDIAITVGVNSGGIWRLSAGAAPVLIGGREQLPARTQAMLEPEPGLVGLVQPEGTAGSRLGTG